mmetsp:Transcript_16096/g.26258  ORF Transcript_16096/g.26258 Transcript_16096/m.26258 type:complete len:281 (-) Transcript_16096:499-1341(-)
MGTTYPSPSHPSPFQSPASSSSSSTLVLELEPPLLPLLPEPLPPLLPDFPLLELLDELEPILLGPDQPSVFHPLSSSVFSHDGAKHASVLKHMYFKLPPSLAQSHTKESNVSPQQVSVPLEQRDPSLEQVAPTSHVVSSWPSPCHSLCEVSMCPLPPSHASSSSALVAELPPDLPLLPDPLPSLLPLLPEPLPPDLPDFPELPPPDLPLLPEKEELLAGSCAPHASSLRPSPVQWAGAGTSSSSSTLVLLHDLPLLPEEGEPPEGSGAPHASSLHPPSVR